ncbi:MAG: leuS, partial [Frankiales bacterium]|nr:leuS [Frankiales bacterium]
MRKNRPNEGNDMTEAVERESYDPHAVQDTWLPVWDKLDLNRAGLREGAPNRYMLDMFPYPSGDLHMGHAEAWGIGDVVARYWMRKGFDVLHPVGWDSFGLPAENAAIRRDAHPAEWTYANIETQVDSFRRYGVSFDWSTRLHTSDPEYYRWTQWLFLRLLKAGLAYRKNSSVNWCPNDQTVLANEQVVGGLCELCKTQVTKRELTQWYFKITDYAQRLLDDLDTVADAWPNRVVVAQRNWIGRSEGAHVDFVVAGREKPLTVYTTRPDTLYGATFMVVAADAALAGELVSDAQRPAYDAYREEIQKATDIERLATDRPKSGVDLGVTATNPVTGEQMPVWASDYVLADYGTGAIMAVPAHDQRDLDFARKFGLPVRRVVDTGEENPEESGVATTGEGAYVASGPLDGVADKATGIRTVIEQ